VSLVARQIEEAGIPTVVIGSARDIVEECGVTRFVFTDLPLGNPMGPPENSDAQNHTLRLALSLLESADNPRTTVQSPIRWPTEEWRDSYMLVDSQNRAALLAEGEARRRAKAAH